MAIRTTCFEVITLIASGAYAIDMVYQTLGLAVIVSSTPKIDLPGL